MTYERPTISTMDLQSAVSSCTSEQRCAWAGGTYEGGICVVLPTSYLGIDKMLSRI